MTKKQRKLGIAEIKSLMEEDRDFLKPMVPCIVQEVWEVELPFGSEGGVAQLNTPSLPLFRASQSFGLSFSVVKSRG